MFKFLTYVSAKSSGASSISLFNIMPFLELLIRPGTPPTTNSCEKMTCEGNRERLRLETGKNLMLSVCRLFRLEEYQRSDQKLYFFAYEFFSTVV